MITRQDCILLLGEIEASGVDVNTQIRELLSSAKPPVSVIKFINDHRQLDATAFYDHIRKSYNNGKSKLYKNIVKESQDDTEELLITLASLSLQILLFAKKVENKEAMLRQVEFGVLQNYSEKYDLIPCLQLITIIKADLKVFESLNHLES